MSTKDSTSQAIKGRAAVAAASPSYATIAREDESSDPNWTVAGNLHGTPTYVPIHSRTLHHHEAATTTVPIPNKMGPQAAGMDITSFTKLQTLVHDIISNWATSKAAKSSKFYKDSYPLWKDGLTSTSTFNTVKRVLVITTLNGYLKHILMCSDVKGKLNLTFDPKNNKILYQQNISTMVTRSQKQDHIIQETSSTASQKNTEMFLQAHTDSKTFGPFQQAIYPVVVAWTKENSSKDHPLYQEFKTWEENLDDSSYFYIVKRHTKVKDLQQYMEKIQGCPAISENFRLQWNEEHQCIQWNMTVSPVKAPESTDTAEHMTLPLPQEKSDMSTLQNTTDEPILAPAAILIPDTAPHEDYGATEYVTSIMLNALKIDHQQEIPGNTNEEGINRFIHYFRDQYNDVTGRFGNYVLTAKSQIQKAVTQAEEKIATLEHRLTEFKMAFGNTMKQANADLVEMAKKVDFLNETTHQCTESANLKIAQNCSIQMELMKTESIKLRETFQSNIDKDITHMLDTAYNNHITPTLDDHIQVINDKGNEIVTQMELICADLVQELQDHSQQYHQKQPEASTATNSTAAPNTTQWRGLPISLNPPTSSYSRAQHHTTETPMEPISIKQNRWGTKGDHHQQGDPRNMGNTRSSGIQPSTQNNELPLLNHRDFINKVKLKYTDGKMFTFYNKLRNIGPQYGIFFKPVENITFDCCLCPEEYQGNPIDDTRYKAMAATVYEKLSDTNCIPDRCSRMRNIVDRYVDVNDSYQVMYKFMEEYHPAMK